MADSPLLDPRPDSLDEEAFLAHYGDLYEHSPWIARAAWRQGLGPADNRVDGLAARLAAVFRAAPPPRQLAVLREHPDLAGKAAVAGALSAHSSAEQALAGLDQCTAEQFERFQRFNHAYRERFAMPFIIAVRGLDREAILAAFERRLANSPAQETATAVEEVNRIARLRLAERAVAAGGPS